MMHSFLISKRKIIQYLFYIIFLSAGFSVNAQQVKLLYNVKKGDNVIGSFIVTENTNGSNKTLALESHIKTSFIVTIEVDAKEESMFQNGVVYTSSVYRKVNGSVKVDKKMRAFNNGYVIESGKKRDTVCCTKIEYNLMNMYTIEPVTIAKVYSDAYQKFIPIKKAEPHVYRIDIPDGSYNKYFYKNGRCVKVEIHQTLYTVTMELT